MALKARVLTRWPSVVEGGDGVAVSTSGGVVTINTGHYDSVASATAANIPSSISIIRVHGYTTAGDGGFYQSWEYERSTTDPGVPGSFQDASDDWWLLRGSQLGPEMFGARGDVTSNYSNIATGTNDTTAFQDMATHANSLGGAIEINLGAKRYRVWSVGTSLTGQRICYFSNINGLRINYNGGQLCSDNTWAAGSGNNQVFLFSGCRGVEVNDADWYQTSASLSTSAVPPTHLYFLDGNDGIRIWDMKMTGGGAGIICSVSAVTALGARTRDLQFTMNVTGVYYAANFAHSGDHVRGVIKSTNGGRSYFPYNVRDHKISIESQHGGAFDDVLIVAYHNPVLQATENTTSDIEFWYACPFGRYNNTTAGSICRLTLAQDDTGNPGAAALQNIKGHFAVSHGTHAHPPLVFVSKGNTGVDTSVRGHVMENIIFDGFAHSYTNGVGLVKWMVAGQGSMVGETVINCGFRDFSALACTDAIEIDAGGFSGGLIMENVLASGSNLTLTNLPAGVLKAGQTRFANYNYYVTEGTANATLTFGGGSTGIVYSQRQLRYRKEGTRCRVWGQIILTNKGSSTGQPALTLPFTAANVSVNEIAPMMGGVLNIPVNTLTLMVSPNTTTALFYKLAANTYGNASEADFTNDTQIFFSFEYETSS